LVRRDFFELWAGDALVADGYASFGDLVRMSHRREAR
jgi:hypothetical protein